MPRGGSRPGAGRKKRSVSPGDASPSTSAALNADTPKRAGNRGKGRKPGVPNKATREIRERAREILEDEAAAKLVAKRYRAGKLHPRLIVMLHEYAYGKPTQHIEHAGEGGGPVEVRFVDA